MTARPLQREDLPALLALQHAVASEGDRWTAARLERELYHPARDHGRKALVIERDGAVVAGAGWVEAGAQFFGSPFFAADEEAAGAALDRLLERGREVGARTMRASAAPLEIPKARALAARGGAHLFDFITLARASGIVEARASPLRRVELTDIPLAAMRELHNETFAGVPNAPPLDDDAVRHAIGSMWREASGVWLDQDDRPAGFIWAEREREEDVEHAVVDSVGVRATWRGRRVAYALVGHLVSAAARAGLPEVRALIASTNEPSLALHRSLGFTERFRRGVWELVLPRRADIDGVA
jgi:ribosomal protein S18 acetylase RimI-like enzyme